MQNEPDWKPSKFVRRNGRLIASRDPHDVNPASRVIADLIAEAFGNHLPSHSRGRLLDLGCGKVPFYSEYRAHVDAITCVDWPGSLHGNRHVDQEVDLTRPLPFTDGSFDTILLSDVLEHIPVPEQLCREMARVLAPGGKLLMNVPFIYRPHEEPHDYYRYTEYAVRRFMALAGLEVLEFERLGGAPEVLADITSKTIQRLPVLGGVFVSLIQGMAVLLRRTAIGRRLSRSTALSFPFGYFLVAKKP